MLFTRSTPQRLNAASSTSSLPVSEPCDAAAFGRALGAPGLITMIGLFNATSRAAERNAPRVADGFHVDDDALGVRIVTEIIDQIAPTDIEHRAERGERAEPTFS